MKKIAVIGIEEGIGREVLNLLAEENISPKNVVALEPRSALGNMVSYGEDDELDVLSLDNFDFKDVEVAIFAVSTEVVRKYAPKAVAAGAKVIDCSGAFVGDEDVPMIVSGINDDILLGMKKNIISVPSADVAQMLIPLQNIARQFDIKRIVVSTYSAVSGYGRAAMDELFNQTRKIFMNETLADDQKVFHKQIAFNVIPQVGEFIGEETACEWNFNAQTKQVLGGEVKVHANCAMIPAFIGSAQFINVECHKEIDVDEARQQIKKVKDVIVFDKQVDGGYVTLHDAQGENGIYISRLRQDAGVENGFSLWCIADNLRAAGARNVLNIIHCIQNNKLN
ncbi:MAG: aspartate-semialdehyde dehydrogenase [Alphaproteobacteria bacterium]|nr:aspartate-semialdehyde dehydrogenase [Alphaproteobacteria bacterium]